MMTVYLFRHGAVEHTGGKLFLGRTDLPLSDEGRIQAESWRHCFMGRFSGTIVSSPLARAHEFARIMAGGRSAAVTIIQELSEIDLGDWDGKPMKDIRQKDPEAWQARGADLARYRPPGGESFADLQKRSVPAFDALVEKADADLAVISHAGVNRVILCHLLGMPLAHLFRIGQDLACLNILDVGPTGIRADRINMPCPTADPFPR